MPLIGVIEHQTFLQMIGNIKPCSVDTTNEQAWFIQALTIAQADHEKFLEIGLARSSKLQKAMNL